MTRAVGRTFRRPLSVVCRPGPFGMLSPSLTFFAVIHGDEA